MAGKKYTDKEKLLDGISKRFNPKIDSAGIHLNICDIIESLWEQGKTELEVVVPTYLDFIQLIEDKKLHAGVLYKVPYQCVAPIPGTGIDNIDSPDYVEKMETFIAQALSEDTIDPWVRSLEHPADKILWDVTLNVSETTGVQRSGKVLYREDILLRNSAHYDIRGVYCRRASLNLNLFTTWIPNRSWTKYQVSASNGKLRRAKIDFTDISNDPSFWQDISPVGDIKWIWGCGEYLTPVQGVNEKDTLTFVNSKGCNIGQTDQNFGYNNVVLENCNNVFLGPGSVNSHVYDCTTVTVMSGIFNSLLGSLSYCSGYKVDKTYFWDSSRVIFNDLCNDGITDLQIVTIGPGSYGCNYNKVESTSIGVNHEGNSLQNVTNSSIANSNVANFYKDIKDSTIENSVVCRS